MCVLCVLCVCALCALCVCFVCVCVCVTRTYFGFCSGFHRSPMGLQWDERHFPLYLSMFLQSACNVTCTARTPQIMNDVWLLDLVAVRNAVGRFAFRTRGSAPHAASKRYGRVTTLG